MAFTLDSDHILRAGAIRRFPWVDHGFGTRMSKNPSGSPDLAGLRQVHSALIIEAHGAGCLGEADALLTNRPGIRLSIRTADCIPVLLVDVRLRAVAAVHAGWRGTAARIVERTVERLSDRYGSVPGDLQVAIGPGIGGCCYEVGTDVAEQFAPWTREPGRRIDLAAINAAQLAAAGVPSSQVHIAGRCTRCEAEMFHSYRRDRDQAGRMVSVIAIRE